MDLTPVPPLDAGGRKAAKMRLALGSWTLHLAGPPSALPAVGAVLSGLRVDGEAPPAVTIALSSDLRSATGAIGTRTLWTLALPPSGWLGAVVGQAVATLANVLTRLLFIHAGAVAADGRGCVIVGESGAGKTSLVASLTRAGATSMADDLVLLDPEHGTILPVIIPLGVKAWTARAAGTLPAGREVACEGGTRYWLPDARAHTPARAAAFVFVGRGGLPGVRPLTRGQALLALAQHTSSLSRRHRLEEAFSGFARVLAAAQCLTIGGRRPAALAPSVLRYLRAGAAAR